MSSCSEDEGYMDFGARWDPYYCCGEFFTSTAEFKVHKLIFHGKQGTNDFLSDYYSDNDEEEDDDDDSCDDEYDYDSFEVSKDSLAAEAEFLEEYLAMLATSMPSKKSKGKAKKSSLKIAKVSRAASKDRIIYSCRRCIYGNIRTFDAKADYLTHTAVFHGTCGVCNYSRRQGQRMGEARFRDEEHYKYGPNCVLNPKNKLDSGAVGVSHKKASHSSEADRSSFICRTCGDTQNFIKSLKCRVCKVGLVVPMPPPSDGLFDDEEDCCDGLFDDGDEDCEHDNDYFGETFGCPNGYFDFEDGCYDDSEDEAMMKYIYLTSMMSSPCSTSKKRSKKSGSENASTSRASSSDHFPLICNKCGMGPFSAKGQFLLHLAMVHRACGVCESSRKVDQTTEFCDEDHCSYARGCVRNVKPVGGDGVIDTQQQKKVSQFEEYDKDLFVCLTCGDSQGSGRALNQHHATVHKKCQTCRIQFDTEDELYGHFSSSKVHLQKYCVPCKMVFCSRESLQIHSAVSHPTGRNYTAGLFWWPCDACNKVLRTFPNEDDLVVHLQSEHVRCFPCKREFVERKSLHDHLVASSKHNFCVRCEWDFVSSQSFISHNCPGIKAQESQKSRRIPNVRIRNLSINEEQLGKNKIEGRDLSCCVCEETFDSLGDRRWHEYDNHLWCSKCDKQLASRRAFNEHQVTCEGHNMCFECGDYFLTPENLVRHQQITLHAFPFANIPSNCNVKTMKFVCDSCDSKVVFKTEKELTMHLSTHAQLLVDCLSQQ